jgi:hypothetical protein
MRAAAGCPATARTASGTPPSSPIGAAAKTPTSWAGCAQWTGTASAASAPGWPSLTPTGERRAGQARRAAVRRLIAAHRAEYQRLLEVEQRRRLQVVEAGSGGGPDAA